MFEALSSRMVLVLGLTALATNACESDESDAAEALVQRSQRGDTTFVHSLGPLHADTATLLELARIGAAAGPNRLLLYHVTAFTQSPDGRIFIADGEGLRAFSADGEFIALVGRKGAGPGEVDYVVGLDVAPDGRLLAVDLGNRRINVYDLNTGDLDHWRLPPGMTGYGRGSIVAIGSGSVYVAINPVPPQDGSPIAFPRPIFLRLNRDGVVVDTLFADERFLEACPTRSSNHWRAGWYEDLRARYFPKVKWAAGRSGTVAVGCPASYTVDLIREDGSVLRPTREWRPVTVTAEERDAFVDGHNWSRSRLGRDGWSWRGPRPPEQKPAYQRIIIGQSGRIWIWPARPSVRELMLEEFTRAGAPTTVWRMPTTGAFDVFARTGEYLGAVRLPASVPYNPFPGSADPLIRGDTLWAISTDSLGVEYLSKFAVQWPESSDRPGAGDPE